MAVLGVDGWRGAWVGALLDGRTVTLLALPDVAAVMAVRDVEVIGIDMPIGLSENGVRACDVAARAVLAKVGAASSVFPAPLRGVLLAADYSDACAKSIAASGKALSRQAWNLAAAMSQLDDALGDPPTDRVVEVHPELAFRTLDGAVADPKITARGLTQRLTALRRVMDVDDAMATAPKRVPAVDALDACAAAWSAQRIADGLGECVGDGAVDSRGRPMRICW